MPKHVGARRRPPDFPVAKVAPLAVAMVGALVLLLLPGQGQAPINSRTRPAVTSSWTGPAPVSTKARLTDGAMYTVRSYLSKSVSVGVAPTTDGLGQRLMLRDGTTVRELHRLSTASRPSFDGFTVDGDNLVWAESTAPNGSTAQTALWRVNWRKSAAASRITTDTGAANFYGSQYDIVIHNGRIYWAATALSGTTTEVRSVALAGGSVLVQRIAGYFATSAWPWLVSTSGGHGQPVDLINLATSARVRVPTAASESASCDPMWCRIGVLDQSRLVQIDLEQPDGSQRRRIAGGEATPTITDVTLADRWVPLKTDAAGGSAVGLSLYDLDSASTLLIATDVGEISGRGSLLWWSTGVGAAKVWHVLDLRDLEP